MSDQSTTEEITAVQSTAPTTVASDVQSTKKAEGELFATNGATEPAAAEDTTAEPKGESEEEPAATTEKKPDYLTKNPSLNQFYESLERILSSVDHREMWGVPLKESYDNIPTINVLIKFLRANEGNVKQAEDQLTEALEWRKKMDPLALLEKGRYNPAKFDGLGYVTKYEEGDSVIVTWNIYGGVKDIDYTFGDLDE